MAVNVGDLIAKLRADTAQFEASLTKAQASLGGVAANTAAAGAAANRANPALGQLNRQMATTAARAVGLTGPMGRVATILAGLAGSGLGITAAVAGIALIASGFNRMRDAARQASEETEKVLEKLTQMRDALFMPAQLVALNAAQQAFQDIQDRITEIDRARANPPGGHRGRNIFEATEGERSKLVADLAEARGQVIAAQNAWDEYRESQRRAQKSTEDTTSAINAQIATLNNQAAALSASVHRAFTLMGAHGVPGPVLPGAALGAGGASQGFSGAFGGLGGFGFRGIDRSAAGQRELARQTAETARNMRRLNEPLDGTPNLLERFGEGMKDAIRVIDPGVLGANLASMGIGWAIGKIMDFGRAAEIAERAWMRAFADFEVMFVEFTPMEQRIRDVNEAYQELRRQLLDQMSGLSISDEEYRKRMRDLDKQYAQNLKSAKMLDDEFRELSSSVRNAPAGYRYEFAQFGAETPTIVIEGDVVVETDDPDKALANIAKAVKKNAARGGTPEWAAFQKKIKGQKV